jgi:hypothetical protein
MSPRPNRPLGVAALLALSLGLGGCLNPFFPSLSSTRVAAEAAPHPDSPQNVLDLLRWCWVNRAYTEYQELFTEDYRFAFAQTDSIGAAYQGWASTRDEDLRETKNLFLGGAGSPTPPAQRIVLYFDPNMVAMDDTRPGKMAPWHKEIRTGVNLTIDNGVDVWRVTGYARFFVVRGDSAKIPAELKLGPDPNRWYIERWEDETAGSGGTAAQPATPDAAIRDPRATFPRPPIAGHGSAARTTGATTWGYVKNLYFSR